MKKPTALGVLVVLACLTWIAMPTLAQSGRGTITGTVTDSSGAIVPDAEITITNKANGEETKSRTTSAGLYRIPYVEPGSYRMTVSLKGFKTATRDNVQVLLAQTVTSDFSLELGEITENITVSSETPLLEASTAEIGTNATERDVRNWPIFVDDGTRQLQDFIFNTMPGTSGNGFEGTINGGQQYSHEILIDGISIGRMDLNGGSNSEFTPTVDAVSEFKLQTGALSSQYGNTQTSLTNFALKSGTNDIHGTLFWFNQNKKLNANTWGNNLTGTPKSAANLNNFGASVGGPIIKNRTHFFFSYEGNRQADFRANSFDSMPVPAFKRGDFSQLFDPAFTGNSDSGQVVGQDALGRDIRFGQIYDPSTTRQLADGTWIRDPFPGNIIPQDKFSSVTRNVLQHDFPDSVTVFNRLRNNAYRIDTCCPVLNIDNWITKIDHVLNDSHKLSGSFTYNDRYRFRDGGGTFRPPSVPIPGPEISGDKTQSTPGWIVRLTEDWTISATKLNHMAFGYNRFLNNNRSNAQLSGTDWASELGMQGVGTNAFPIIRFRGNNNTVRGLNRDYGHGGGTFAPNGSTIFQNDFTWINGSHSFRMGGEIRRYYLNERGLTNTGSYTYHNEQTGLPNSTFLEDALNSTGFSYASFLLGQAQSANLDIIALTPGMRSQTLAFYFQDDWKASSKLTLNLGLRWDIPTPLHEVASRMSGLDPNVPNPGADGYPGAFVVLGDGPGRTGAKSFADTYYRQFGPRFGLAYAATSKLVVRGGYGINFTPPISDGFDFPYFTGFNGPNPITRKTAPFVGTVAYNWDTPYPAFEGTLPTTDPTLLNGADIAYYSPDLNRLPYVQNWNFGIQYELPWQTVVEANYIGNKGTRLSATHNGQTGLTGRLNQSDSRYLSLGDTLLDSIDDHPEFAKPYPSFSGTVGESLKPFPQYYNVQTHRLNDGWSSYHAAQLTVTKRASRGLSFLAAYTFSKTMATSDSTGPGDYYYYHSQDFYNRKADYSVTRLHRPHDLKFSWIYDAPFGKGGRWFQSGAMSYILGGWTVAAIHRYQSGAPLPINDGNWEATAIFNPGIRGDILLPPDQWIAGSKPTSPDLDAGNPYLNPAAFGPAPKTPNNVPLRFGNSPRYLSGLRGFASYGENLSLVKRTDLGFREGMNLEFRIDVRNLFNRIGICDPELDVNDPDRFGRVFSKCGGPRNIQFGARFTF
jgi:Carboxypeptidase regulatory-like domain/TonB dependent receptor-like, beta-barrel